MNKRSFFQKRRRKFEKSAEVQRQFCIEFQNISCVIYNNYNKTHFFQKEGWNTLKILEMLFRKTTLYSNRVS